MQTIKEMMASSIHPVFWTGLCVIAVGILVGQFLGRESLTAQLKRQQGGHTADGHDEDEDMSGAFAGH